MCLNLMIPGLVESGDSWLHVSNRSIFSGCVLPDPATRSQHISLCILSPFEANSRVRSSCGSRSAEFCCRPLISLTLLLPQGWRGFKMWRTT